ncbi:MAG: hypothetical protein LBI14_02125 [Treponema sp.]|nr:hypothetical protein [Treponema sp.]
MLADESSNKAFSSILRSPYLRPTALRCIHSIFRNFFLLQYKAALNPRRFKISRVDHPLDRKIPFRPEKVEIYLDFVPFFIRILGFLLKFFNNSDEHVKNSIESLGALYARAAEVYSKNYSTTDRPRYLKRFRFIVIHTFDPHLLCIPSLHVMIVIRAYTQLRETLKKLGEEENRSSEIEEARQRALEITEAVLYIKQHSINCISAAMYAMSCFDDLFPPEEAEQFARDLFVDSDQISKEDAEAIREHILSLYRQFLDQGQNSSSWEMPLLDFLASQPKK